MISIVRNLSRWMVARVDIRNERAATAVEYGLMLALIAAVIIVAVVFLGRKTSSTFECTGKTIELKTDQC
jgi:pilus assembly protein Flp/PilA